MKYYIQVAAAEAVDREFVYIELEEASPTIPHITDPRSQSPRIPPPDAGYWMPDPRCRIPESHFEAWLAGWHSHPIAWLNRSWGRVWGGVGALKKGTISE